MFKESLHNDFWILEIESVRTNARHFPKSAGTLLSPAPRVLSYCTDSSKPLPVVKDAEAKVAFKFVFDYKMNVLVVVNNLFFNLLKKSILSQTGQIW